MPDLHFQVEAAEVTPNAAVPLLSFKVRATDLAGPRAGASVANSAATAVANNGDTQPIHSIALRVQVQIEPVRRRYTPGEQAQLKELFGAAERWSKTLHPLLWTNTNVNVPGFTGSTVIDVPVPCTFDFNVAITKYIYGLEAGEIPVTLLFSGTVFYAGRVGLQIAQIPWDREASYRLPVALWKEMMELHYPKTAWLCLQREVFEKLYSFKARHGIPTWERALERVLELSEAGSDRNQCLESGMKPSPEASLEPSAEPSPELNTEVSPELSSEVKS